MKGPHRYGALLCKHAQPCYVRKTLASGALRDRKWLRSCLRRKHLGRVLRKLEAQDPVTQNITTRNSRRREFPSLRRFQSQAAKILARSGRIELRFRHSPRRIETDSHADPNRALNCRARALSDFGQDALKDLARNQTDCGCCSPCLRLNLALNRGGRSRDTGTLLIIAAALRGLPRCRRRWDLLLLWLRSQPFQSGGRRRWNLLTTADQP